MKLYKQRILVILGAINCIFAGTQSFGQIWKPVGNGIDNLGVFGIYPYNGGIYAVGDFNSPTSSIDNIAFWDSSNWIPVGQGILGGVYTVTEFNGELHVGGSFTTVAGYPNVEHVARWDGTDYHNLGAGILSGFVYAIQVYNGDLYVGGSFQQVAGMPMRNFAKWDGSQWYNVGVNVNGSINEVRAMAVFNNELYVAGLFGSIGGVQAYNLAKYDGTAWSAVGGGMNSTVFYLMTDTINNRLYACGNFTHAGGGTVPCPSNIAYWDGGSWYPVGNGPSISPRAMCMYKNQLICSVIGPSFTNTAGDTLSFIAQWDGTDWQPLGRGVNGSVLALQTIGNDLWVGGGFTQAGDTTANMIATWTDTTTSSQEVFPDKSDVIIVPNPCTITAEVILPHGEFDQFPFRFTLYSITGTLIMEKTLYKHKVDIDCRNIPSGIYFYTVENDKWWKWRGKMMIQ